MFSRFLGKKPVPLSGAPAVRRMKTHSAQSGYVYQYSYQGQRPSKPRVGIEFVFSASADRKTWRDLSVIVDSDAVAQWQAAHGRDLSNTEWYAVAKLSLFEAMDARPTPEAMWRAPVVVDAAGVKCAMELLDDAGEEP